MKPVTRTVIRLHNTDGNGHEWWVLVWGSALTDRVITYDMRETYVEEALRSAGWERTTPWEVVEGFESCTVTVHERIPA